MSFRSITHVAFSFIALTSLLASSLGHADASLPERPCFTRVGGPTTVTLSIPEKVCVLQWPDLKAADASKKIMQFTLTDSSGKTKSAETTADAIQIQDNIAVIPLLLHEEAPSDSDYSELFQLNLRVALDSTGALDITKARTIGEYSHTADRNHFAYSSSISVHYTIINGENVSDP